MIWYAIQPNNSQGIIGASLPEIKSLELKALTDETEVIQAEEI